MNLYSHLPDTHQSPSGGVIQLYNDGKFKEAEIIANAGLSMLISLYARGGSLSTKVLTQCNINKFSAYLDILYWVALKKAENNDIATPKELTISSANFFAKHLQATNLYEPIGFQKLYFHCANKIVELRDKLYKVYISCCWVDTATLYKNWNHLFEDRNFSKAGDSEDLSPEGERFKDENCDFILTDKMSEADYYVIIWGSQEPLTEWTKDRLSRTIFCRSEPLFPDTISFGGRAVKADPLNFLKFYDYTDKRYPNIAENWIKEKPSVLLNNIGNYRDFFKGNNTISAIVSDKYFDPGHIYRIDLLRYIIEQDISLSGEIAIDIYGFNNNLGFPEEIYKGPLPEYNKCEGLLKYKYTLIAENHAIDGYLTEKIVDGILSECLVFYWGCPNLEYLLPPFVNDISLPAPFVRLPMDDKVESLRIIVQAIQEDWWAKRIDSILHAKKYILTKMMMPHRISEVIREDIDRKILGEDAMNLLRLATSLKVIINETGYRYTKILYSGERYEALSEMLNRRLYPLFMRKYIPPILQKYNGRLEDIPDNTPFMQELCGNYTRDPKTIQSYIVHPQKGECLFNPTGTKFSIKNFSNSRIFQTFVINLARRPDRLKAFEERWLNSVSKGWFAEIFNAIDGKTLDVNDPTIQYLFRNNDFGFKPSIIGCALSHLSMWRSLLCNKEYDYYIIYEDDVEFVDNYEWKLWSCMQSITFAWDVLYLGHLVCYDHQTTHRVENNVLPVWENMVDYIIPKRTSWVGTASYMISKRGAKKLIDHIDKFGVQHGLDYFMQLATPRMIKAYALNPMLNFAEYASPLNPKGEVDTDIQC